MQTAFKTIINILVGLSFPLCICAQQNVEVYGKMKLEKGSLDGTIELFENGSRKSIRKVDGSGKFSFNLDLDKQYVFSFAQEGYVTKKIAYDTKVSDPERKDFGFAPFEFQVTLFKQYEGVNFVVFNQPVGRIMYSEEIGDFDYDTDYTKSIQQRLQEVEKEVEKKSKEEDKQEKQKEKIAEVPKDPPPNIEEKTEVSREDPPTPRKKLRPPPPPPPNKPLSNVVVLHSYTVGELGYPNLNAYGFINFGDGAGRREITKEQFDEYAKKYH
ncbi:MAG: hypothetical protein RIC15_06845 [Vicingaceae bacterium]